MAGLRDRSLDLWRHLQRPVLLARAIWRRRQVSVVRDRTAEIAPGDILCFATLRNEAVRLPFFLDHHRRLGIRQFLIVDNGSDDGTLDLLCAQPDVSVWRARAGYRQARFGLDWLTGLQMRHGHGHWCLTLDADEALIYPYWQTRDLRALTGWLEGQGRRSFAAMMLDMYPKGRLSQPRHVPGDDPFAALCWHDAANYTIVPHQPKGNLWIQGGPRARVFFGAEPRRAPTLNKVPLVKWHRRYAYLNSTHRILPAGLNRTHAADGGEWASGVLLHSKFLDLVVARSVEEKARAEHFARPQLYDSYYDAVAADPDLWCRGSRRYRGWRGLEAAGLMSRGGWI